MYAVVQPGNGLPKIRTHKNENSKPLKKPTTFRESHSAAITGVAPCDSAMKFSHSRVWNTVRSLNWSSLSQSTLLDSTRRKFITFELGGQADWPDTFGPLRFGGSQYIARAWRHSDHKMLRDCNV